MIARRYPNTPCERPENTKHDKFTPDKSMNPHRRSPLQQVSGTTPTPTGSKKCGCVPIHAISGCARPHSIGQHQQSVVEFRRTHTHTHTHTHEIPRALSRTHHTHRHTQSDAHTQEKTHTQNHTTPEPHTHTKMHPQKAPHKNPNGWFFKY
jgi:hypothetical protein